MLMDPQLLQMMGLDGGTYEYLQAQSMNEALLK
jgi:hypothetical protein